MQSARADGVQIDQCMNQPKLSANSSLPAEVKSRDAERTRARILQAARSEFAENGLAGTRLDGVAQAAGVDKRLIYYYLALLHKGPGERSNPNPRRT